MRDLKAMIENEIGREVKFSSVKKTNDVKTAVTVIDRHVSPAVYVDDILHICIITPYMALLQQNIVVACG